MRLTGIRLRRLYQVRSDQTQAPCGREIIITRRCQAQIFAIKCVMEKLLLIFFATLPMQDISLLFTDELQGEGGWNP